MSVTITLPEGGVFGPGINIQITTDFIGPLPLNTSALVEVFRQGGEQRITGWLQSPFTNGMAVPLDLPHQVFSNPLATARDGDQVVAKVTLEGEGGFTDTGTSSPMTWSSSGQIMELLQQMQTTIGAGGFTSADRATLQAVDTATVAKFGATGTPIEAQISELLAHPLVGLLQLQVLPIVGQGDGAIDGDHNFFPTIFGLWWQFDVVPSGIGFLEGPTRHYEERMIQLRAIQNLNGADLVAEVVDADYDRVIWLWRDVKPVRIEYHVLPGVSVTFAYVTHLP